MGFRILKGTIEGQQQITFTYSRNGGADFLAQYAMANPVSDGHTLEVTAQGKRQEFFSGTRVTTYLVTVRSPERLGTSTRVELVGGGLT